MENKKITTMEDTISIVLRAGVLLSIIVICAGLFLHIVLKLSAGSLIIKTGLYILFLTPFARLVVSLLMFLIEKDLIYFAITLSIILIIIGSNLLVSINF
ncbi:uncharacterized protein DUF1634 [Caldicellulosiruptor bescii]|uniref:DUF1634 domain-containing protein n=2 Tax=Caldicellulosiruptor bescii TaxID=31899 RepID=B9MM62_CALBD|nr:DUF1634 domain-containing protein [Caldicellulosiruptor bescii]ACM61285.1 protein of unknown function DUF1634 [Caldicellulosiruptor bescii DSM 6725]PBC88902.1 uncharacterized protein DUF1634 [Caldicellulosiruptor bescii]PBC91616.1 uncharacterized protein DUF1634 [Caldicellulosiruptor bescii]PBD02971.1 uncharacterized protein DUF1634 [Caldicellulosiruptor bescii]PBD07413.1 uncharacterized protein DUF1634 [Caldicellulosiruptor bescii]